MQITIRGVSSADEDQLENFQRRVEGLGGKDVAIIHFPLDTELGLKFQIEEEKLGELLEPATARAAA